MKTITRIWSKRFLPAATLVTVMALTLGGQAALVGPYTPDASTLHLWHLNETVTPAIDSATSGGTNLVGLLNGATMGTASFTGFGNALSTLDGGQDGTAAANKDALLTPSTASPPGNVTLSYADPTTGAFTFEAVVWIGFDPAKNLGTVAVGGNGRNTALEIISTESGATAGRIFQFRIMPVGAITGVTVPVVTFENIRAGSAAQATIYAPIPTTGPDAIVSNNWYHVAVTYNGSANTANNLKLYWTLMDPTRTIATQLTITSPTTTLSGLNPLASTATPFVIGNEARNRTGNFLGLVDEVRISKVERSAVGMMFAPAAVAIVTPPASQLVAAGDTVTLSSVAGGGAPLFYQWQFQGTNLPGATNASLVLPNINTNQAGGYRIIVTNLTSAATSSVATVRVGGLFAELFNTGVADDRTLLAGGAQDPHWQLVQSDDPAYPGPAVIADSFPPGAWLPNGPNSLWVSPGDGVSNAGGLYTYRTSFLLDTLDATNAQLVGNWVSDNPGLDIRLNGVSLGITNSLTLGSFTPFTITNGFVAGSNALECVVSNAFGAGINPTGVRVEMRGVALLLPPTAPQFVTLPANVSTQQGQGTTFTAVVVGTGPLAYQWFFGATPLTSQTNRALRLTGLTPVQSGNYTVVVTNSLGSINATAALTVVTPPSLAWLGLTTGDWDTLTTNWLDTGSSANVAFAASDDVLFDGRGSGAPTVNLTEVLLPNSVTVDANNDYTLTSASGTGLIAGSLSLTKRGIGTLILDTANTYSGTTLIQGGTLQVGNGDTSGSLGSSSVSDNATLLFNRADAFPVPNTISGTGSVTMAGFGTVILMGSNSYTGPTTISSGTVSVRKNTALGSTAAGTTVASGAQLYFDVNIDIAGEPLLLSGAGLVGDGALRKGGAGTTTFGGPIALADSALIKLDGNSTLNLTNLSGITGTNVSLSVQSDGGSRLTVSGPLNLGAGTFAQNGPGTTVLAAPANNWTGGTTISGGTLQIGDGGTNGSLGNGPIQDDATLTFFSANNLVITNVISGGGGVNQNGNGILNLNAVNAYGGTTRISGTGTLRPGNSQALGAGTITIGAAQTDTSRLELTGDILLSNPITIFPRAFGVLNNPADVVNVSGTNILNGPSSIVIPSGGNLLTFESDSGLLIVSNGVTAGGVGRFLVLKGAAAGQIYGALDQTGANSQNLYKLDAGAWTLFGANTYSGTTTISNGTLIIHGSLGTNILTVAGGTLGGTGVISGPVVINAGGTLAPGPSIGTLTINNTLALQPGSITSVEINRTANTSDEVLGLTSVSYGGTLVVSNLSGTLALNDSFTLFAATAYTGAFANISPATPGTGLAWNTNFLAIDGTLRVASAATRPTITGTTVSGGNLVLSGSGGAAGSPYVLLSSTNVAAPIATWTPVSTNSFDGTGHFSVTNAVSPLVPRSFFLLQAQ